MKRLFLFWLLIVCLPELLFAQTKTILQNHPVVIRNVTLIDMRSEQPQTAMTVVIESNHIAKISKSNKVKIPKGAQVVDATGKFLIPGLWDNYTFTLDAVRKGFPYFELLIAFGVTGVRDAGTGMDLREIAKLRDEINGGKILAPRLYYNGTVIDGAGEPRESNRFTGNSVQVKTADEARATVESLYRAGVDYIKTEKLLPPEILKEVIADAHEHNMRVVSVPPSFIIDASDDGLDCVEHFVELYRTTSTKRNEYYAFYRDRETFRSADEAYAFFKPLRDTRDQPYYDQTLQTMARNKTFLVTNIAEQGHSMETFELADPSRRRFKTKKQIEQLDEAIKVKERQRLNRDYRTDEKAWRGLLQDVADLHKAGVMLLAGTQLNISEPSSPGIFLHDELYWFVQAGLSPFEALKTATVNPAIFMRREKDLGTIEKGKLADLILLDANPLQDISNTRKINGVVVNGRYLSKEFLQKMLSDVEAKVNRQ
jgi:hypothetical protein